MILRVNVKLSVIVIVMVMLLLEASSASAHSPGNKITCYSLLSPVVVDGKWTTPQEWQDAAEVAGIGVYLRVKHDESFIYILVDHLMDSQLDTGPPAKRDQCWIALDINHDGGSKPLSDDRAFWIQYNPAKRDGTMVDLVVEYGMDTGWSYGVLTTSTFSGSLSTDVTNNSRSKSPHLTFEMKIPRSVLANATVADGQKAATMGIQMAVFDAGQQITRQWPKSCAANVPDSWGDLEFSTSKAPGPNMHQVPTVIQVCPAMATIFSKKFD